MATQVEFLKETKVNNRLVSKGEKLSFTDDVAQKFINAGDAKKPGRAKSKK
jgi:hypothetical protein